MEITAWAAVAALINVVGIFWIKERLRQSIKHDYDKSLEKLRHSLAFELDQKKIRYQGKLAQYKKYYALLDSYSEKSRKALFSKFNTGLMAVIKDPSQENTLDFMRDTLSLQDDISDLSLTFKNEIGGLRLEAGERLLALLDEYLALMEITEEKTVGFLNWTTSNIEKFFSSPEEINRHIDEFFQSEVATEGRQFEEIQREMFLEMRRELGIV